MNVWLYAAGLVLALAGSLACAAAFSSPYGSRRRSLLAFGGSCLAAVGAVVGAVGLWGTPW